MRLIDLTGKVFGRLTVVGRAIKFRNQPYWTCKCNCGNTADIPGSHLRGSLTKSCGCLKREGGKKHGHSKKSGVSPEYSTWANMISRCKYPSNPRYKYYGGRGITVDPRWKDFRNFLIDMGPRPSRKHSIDRINNDLGYSKENCRWATASIQSRNTTQNTFVVFQGERMCLLDACEKAGVKYGSVRETRRLKGVDIQTSFDYHIHRITT